jgi:hypothetical protein
MCSVRSRDVQTDQACRAAQNPTQVWPVTNPAGHVVNRARVGPVRSPGRAWAEGVARQARPGTARFYFFI